jgi:hypothetical protein
LESNTELQRIVRVLIHRQRRLIHSSDLAERFHTLWIAALLDEHLTQCTDCEIGELLILVQERFHIFEPEFGIVTTLGKGYC